ncbi:two-component sensor histidine kinase [Paractinoplanes abujensis]|uniref:histidine kinase n=1 Tax=Paractinoplanes abujensis TaxID=882441 RepID=A0A7W7FZJ7_9ACTN|nr:sensor histidine kinase [Actinoplanes abujensis]MBB4690175.1 signal transduction histidine kinase [Actinoplanes abujensis]GID20942.1 two-component sensor histidine kinase [Actinoplanes abujensis]
MWLSSRRAFLLDLAVSGSMVALSTWWWHQFRWGGLSYGMLLGVALLWRRSRPVLVLAVVTVLAFAAAPVVVDGSQLHEGMLLTSLGVASHAVVAYSRSLVTAAGGALAALVGGTLLVEVRPSAGQGWSPVEWDGLASSLLSMLTVAAVFWAAGLGTRFWRQQRAGEDERRRHAERERADQARIAVAEERARIARELHDIVAHSLSVIVLQANGGEYAFDRDPQRAREALRTIGATGADALEEIRHLVRILRGAGEADRDHAVASVVDRARAAGVDVALVVQGDPPPLPGGVELAVYRIVQESLTNTLKHAGPGPSATVRVTYRPGDVELEVTDTGAGRSSTAPSGGHGLVGMRERATLYGGTFDAGPALAGGWRVRARIPLTAEAVPA